MKDDENDLDDEELTGWMAFVKGIFVAFNNIYVQMSILLFQLFIYIGTFFFIMMLHDFLDSSQALGILIYICVAFIGTAVNLDHNYNNPYNANFKDISTVIVSMCFL